MPPPPLLLPSPPPPARNEESWAGPTTRWARGGGGASCYGRLQNKITAVPEQEPPHFSHDCGLTWGAPQAHDWGSLLVPALNASTSE